MSLIPFAWMRASAPWLRPLRFLARRRWVRESDIDMVLAALHPAWRLNRVFARVEARRWVADDMLALTLRANGNWQGPRPGQHVQVYLEQQGVRLCRSYSPTALGADGTLEIAVKRQPGGRVSPRLVDWLAVGHVLELGPAYGELHWDLGSPGAVLLAAGSGITPLLGLMRDALAQGFRAPITLLHYVREQGQRAFVSEIRALQEQYDNLRVRWAVRDDTASELQGRFQGAHLDDSHAVGQVLACGPAGFVEQVRAWHREVGHGGVFQGEAFTPPTRTHGAPPQALQLTFARSQQRITVGSQRSLLELAEAHGLRPVHGCRQGICASCTCQLLAGVVRDLRNDQLLSEPGQSIRLCISAVHGDVVIDL